MPHDEDKMLCLVRFLGLLIQTSDTSDLFYTFNILKFKRLAPKGHIIETQQSVNTWLLWVMRAGSRKHTHTATSVALQTRILQD